MKAGGASKDFVQTHADTPASTTLASKATPDKPDDFARNWHDKMFSRLILMELYGKGETPPGGAPQVTVRLDYFAKGRPKGFLELGYGSGANAKTLFARTEYTASWASLHASTEDPTAEAKKVAGAK